MMVATSGVNHPVLGHSSTGEVTTYSMRKREVCLGRRPGGVATSGGVSASGLYSDEGSKGARWEGRPSSTQMTALSRPRTSVQRVPHQARSMDSKYTLLSSWNTTYPFNYAKYYFFTRARFGARFAAYIEKAVPPTSRRRAGWAS